ncbi:putative glycolipid-binding domain-containing protein [Jiangella asiatica]|uniref:Transcriptional regulator n=1 Tax=Jiangella asiatica TaxID=2530372 RepID=A0A4R5DJH7_9ACTN|nr:putative glycolipid-binding domain-containing protein [Jiangella asiatica]TDE10965.1 transcriptional regulator [Jiangella asiatica]
MFTGYSAEPLTRDVMWTALSWPAIEHLDLRADRSSVVADAVVVALDGRPTRLGYRIVAAPDWTVRRLELRPHGEPDLVLERRAGDRWYDGAGVERHELAGCVDVDIALTPFTNTLPIRRVGLAAGDSADLRMVYVQVEHGLDVIAVDQYYMRLGADTYRYRSGDFTADLTVDVDGLVIDYPGLWRRLV